MSSDLTVLIRTLLQAPTEANIKEVQTKIQNSINTTLSSSKGIKLLNQNEIDLYQRKMKNMLANLSIGKENILSSPAIKKDMETFLNDLSKVGTISGKSKKELGVQFSELSTKVRQGAYEMSLLRKDTDDFGTTLVKNTGKMIQWGIAGTAIYGTLRQIREGVTFINDLNKAMTNIEMITGKSQATIASYTQEYVKLASTLHDTTSNVMKASEEFLRAGHSQEETLALIKSSTVMSKIAGQDQKETADQLIAITNGFKISAEDTMSVVDKLTTVDNASATSTKELGIAMERTAVSAQMAGANFNQLVSYIATVSDVSRKSASSIGESFKTIFARYQDVRGGKNFDTENQDISNVARDLKKYADIEIRSSEGEFKDFSVVIDELAKKWGDLSEVQQSAVAKAMAGVRQRENLLILLNNYNKALDLQTKEENSAGSAMERYGVFAKSTEAKINDLTNAIQKQWMNALNSDTINSFIEITTKLVNTFGNLPYIVEIATTALLIFKGKAILDGITAIATYVFELEALIVKEGLVAVATNGVSSAFNKLKVVFMENPLGAMAVLFTTLTTAVLLYNQHQEELIQKADQAATSFQNEMSKIDDLTSQYITLASKTNLSNQEKQSLLSTEGQLRGAIGDTTGQIDAQNKSLAENIALLQQMTGQKLQEFVTGHKEEYENANKDLWGNQTPWYSAEGIARNVDQTIEAAKKSIDYWSADTSNSFTRNQGLKNATELYNEMIQKRDRDRNIINTYNEALDRLNNPDKYIVKKPEVSNTGSPSGNYNGGSSGSKSSSTPDQYDEYALKDYTESIKNADNALKLLDNQKSKLIKTSIEYQENLKAENTLLLEKQSLAHEEANRLRSVNYGLDSQIQSLSGIDWNNSNDTERQGAYNSLSAKQKKELNDLTRDYDTNTKAISDNQQTWIEAQKSIDTNNTKILDTQITNVTDSIKPLNTQMELLSDKMSLLSDTDFEGKIDLIGQQISLNKAKLAEFNSEFSTLQQKLSTTTEPIEIQKISQSMSDLTQNMIDTTLQTAQLQKQLKDVEFQQFENGITQLTKSLDPYANKISNIQSNMDLLSETNYSGKLSLIGKEISANNSYISELESSLSDLKSTDTDTAQEEEALATAISNTTSKLYEAKKNTVLYARELSKLQLAKIKDSFDKVTSSLEAQIGVTEHIIEMMTDGVPTGIDLNFNYATNVVDNTAEEDAQAIADAGIDVQEQFYTDLAQSQQDYNAQSLADNKAFITQELADLKTFFDEIAKLMGNISGINVMDTTISDFAKAKNASDETIASLKKLEEEIQKNTKISTDKLTDINKDGVIDVKDELLSGYTDNITNTKDYFTTLKELYGTNWSAIEADMKTHIANMSSATPSTSDVNQSTNTNNSSSTNTNSNTSTTTIPANTGASLYSFNKDATGVYFDADQNLWMADKSLFPSGYSLDGAFNYNGYYSIGEVFRKAGKRVEVEGEWINVYAKGTDGHPGGWAQIDDGTGNELIIEPNEKPYIHKEKGSKFVNLPKGTQVIPAEETEDILKNRSYSEGTLKGTRNYTYYWGLWKGYYGSNSNLTNPYFPVDGIDNNGSVIKEYYWGDDGTYIGNSPPSSSEITSHIGTTNTPSSSTSTNASVTSLIPSWTGSEADLSKVTDKTTGTTLKTDVESFIKNNLPSASDIDFSNIKSDELSSLFSEAIIQATSDIINAGYDSITSNLKTEITNQRAEVNTWSAIANGTVGESYTDEHGNVVDNLTESVKSEASEKAITATNALITAENKLKSTIKAKFDYEFSALEKESIKKDDALQDDLEYQQSLLEITNPDNYNAKISVAEQLLGSEKTEVNDLTALKNYAIEQQKLYAIGSAEWTDLQTRIDAYQESIEDATSAVYEQAKALGELKATSVTDIFDDEVKSINNVISAFGNLDTDAEIEAVDKLKNNIGNTLIKEAKSIADKINNIKAEIKVTTDETKLVELNTELDSLTSKQYEVRISLVENAESIIDDYNDGLKEALETSEKLADLQEGMREAELDQGLKIAGGVLDEINNQIDAIDNAIELSEDGLTSGITPTVYVNPTQKYMTPAEASADYAAENPIEDTTVTSVDTMNNNVATFRSASMEDFTNTINAASETINSLGTITAENAGEFLIETEKITNATSAMEKSIPNLEKTIRTMGENLGLPSDVIEAYVVTFTAPISQAIDEANNTVSTKLKVAGDNLVTGLLNTIQTTTGTFTTAMTTAETTYNTNKNILDASVNTGTEESKTAYAVAAQEAVQSAYDYVSTLNTALGTINARIVTLEQMKKDGTFTDLDQAELTALQTVKINIQSDINVTETSIAKLGTQIQEQLSAEDISKIDIKIGADTTSLTNILDDVLTPKTDGSDTLTLNVTGDTAEAVTQVQTFFDTWDQKPITFDVSALTDEAQTAIQALVDSWNNKTITIKTVTETEETPGYASGTDSHPGGIARIAEKGQEIVIINGKMYLSGDDGAELVNLPKGSQVIANQETERILKEMGIPSYETGIGDTTNTISQITVSAGTSNLLNEKIKLLKQIKPIIDKTVAELLEPIAQYKQADGSYKGTDSKSEELITNTISQIQNLTSAAQTAQVAYRTAFKEMITESIEPFSEAIEDIDVKTEHLNSQISILEENEPSVENYKEIAEKTGETLVNEQSKNKELRDSVDSLTAQREALRDSNGILDTTSYEYQTITDEINTQNAALDDSNEKLITIGKSLSELNYDSATQAITDATKQFSDDSKQLQFEAKFIDEDDVALKVANINKQIKVGYDEIATRQDAIKNVDNTNWDADKNGVLSDTEKADRQKFLDEQQEALEDSVLNVHDLEEQKLDIYENVESQVLDMIKDRVDKEKEALDETLEATEDSIDKRIDYINKLYETQDYESGLKDEESTLNDLYKKQSDYMLDDSVEGKVKQKEIAEQIIDQEKTIAKLKRDNSKELRIEALNDAKETAEEETQIKKDALDAMLEDTDTVYAAIQQLITTGKTSLLTSLNDSKTGVLDLNSSMETFFTNTGTGLSTVGQELTNFTANLTAAQEAVKSGLVVSPISPVITVGGTTTTVGSTVTTSTSSTPTTIDTTIPTNKTTTGVTADTANVKPVEKTTTTNSETTKEITSNYDNMTYDQVLSTLKKAGSNVEQVALDIMDMNNMDYSDKVKVKDAMIAALKIKKKDYSSLTYDQALLVLNYAEDSIEQTALNIMDEKAIDFSDKVKVKDAIITALKTSKNLASLDTGGMTGDFSGSKFAMLHKNEIILDAVDSQTLLKTLKTVDLTQNLLTNIKPLSFDNLTSGTLTKQDLNLNFENLITVQGNVDKDALPGLKTIVNSAISQMKSELKRQGIY